MSHIIELNAEEGRKVLYKLVSAVQHLGSTVSGHFIALCLDNQDNVFVANDRLLLQRLEDQVDSRMCLERSTLYLYRKITRDPEPEPMDVDNDGADNDAHDDGNDDDNFDLA